MGSFAEQLLEALGRDTGAYRRAPSDSEQPAIVIAVRPSSSRKEDGGGGGSTGGGGGPGRREKEGAPTGAPVVTDEEIALLAEIATGATTEVAARRLGLTARRLRRRLRGICDELGVDTPIEAVVWAARRQLI
ncbi:DNA-binding NarL/FixJ family response regulator [Nocardiopsis mwathae]|uniref:DNA-binding NarL/FixJ family response regulator n=1 Tax=Nocardiopsis mwathae TaxID=1472723 RepID=A0A7W9YH95_9ACTN|nr:hypothetical protein [Nocardiopsis mwathae]MBB6172120.1 DNA-binding NarL/FixJ family response regulator [Nocardiopsis mwathae]